MNAIDNMAEGQLIDGFLLESWECNSEDYGSALNQLLSILYKNGSFREVLKLIDSNIESANLAGVWLAAMFGKKAVCIFDEIKGLIHSENVKIKYEIMECYLECASSGDSVLDLVRCLGDDELAVRLRALDYLKFLSDEQVLSAYSYAFNKGDPYYKYLSIFKKQFRSRLAVAEIEKGIVSEDCLCKKFFYMAALRGGEDIEVLGYLARASGDDDINSYFESYIK